MKIQLDHNHQTRRKIDADLAYGRVFLPLLEEKVKQDVQQYLVDNKYPYLEYLV
jgi:hypothetical protein